MQYAAKCQQNEARVAAGLRAVSESHRDSLHSPFWLKPLAQDARGALAIAEDQGGARGASSSERSQRTGTVPGRAGDNPTVVDIPKD